GVMQVKVPPVATDFGAWRWGHVAKRHGHISAAVLSQARAARLAGCPTFRPRQSVLDKGGSFVASYFLPRQLNGPGGRPGDPEKRGALVHWKCGCRWKAEFYRPKGPLRLRPFRSIH